MSRHDAVSSLNGLKIVCLLLTLILIFERKFRRWKELNKCPASIEGVRIAWVHLVKAYLIIWLRKSAGCVTDTMPRRGGDTNRTEQHCLRADIPSHDAAVYLYPLILYEDGAGKGEPEVCFQG